MNWKSIISYEGLYEINEHGVIRNVIHNTLKKNTLGNRGYMIVVLWKNRRSKCFFIHKLLAINFIANPKKYRCVNHKDGNKLNNSIPNLEWCNHSYNNKHAYALGLKHSNKKPVFRLDINGNVIERYESLSEVVNDSYRCCNVHRACNNPNYKHKGFYWRYA